MQRSEFISLFLYENPYDYGGFPLSGSTDKQWFTTWSILPFKRFLIYVSFVICHSILAITVQNYSKRL